MCALLCVPICSSSNVHRSDLVLIKNYVSEQNLSFLLSIQSVGHLLVSCVTSLYVILAVRYFEEPALMKSMSTDMAYWRSMQCCLVEYVIAC